MASHSASESHIKCLVCAPFTYRKAFTKTDISVLVDAQMIQDTNRFSMDLVAGLERTLHGKVKPSTPLLNLCCPASRESPRFKLLTSSSTGFQ